MKKRYTEEQIIDATKRNEAQSIIEEGGTSTTMFDPTVRWDIYHLPSTHNRRHNREDLIGQVLLNQR